MGGPGLITVAQAFVVSVTKFDDFLESNNPSTLAEYRPDRDDIAEIAKLFNAQSVPYKVKVFVPCLPGYDLTQQVYVCCDWFHVSASQELPDKVLQKPVHPASEEMRKLIGAENPVSRYVIYHADGDLEWIDQVSTRRNTVRAKSPFYKDTMVHVADLKPSILCTAVSVMRHSISGRNG